MLMRIFGCVVGVVFLLSLAGCSGDSPSSNSSKHIFNPVGVEGVPDVIITDTRPDELPGFELAVLDARVCRDSLILVVEYGGGCIEHTFSCYMSPAAFMESLPAQANLYVLDNMNNDPCDGVVTVDAVFDLSTVANLYYQHYGTTFDIILNIHDLSSGVPVKKLTVMYDLTP